MIWERYIAAAHDLGEMVGSDAIGYRPPLGYLSL
jgi:hypothetical protein